MEASYKQKNDAAARNRDRRFWSFCNGNAFYERFQNSTNASITSDGITR